jgi:hypothetical protein
VLHIAKLFSIRKAFSPQDTLSNKPYWRHLEMMFLYEHSHLLHHLPLIVPRLTFITPRNLFIAFYLWKFVEREQANYTTLASRIIAVTFVTQREELATNVREMLSEGDFNDLRFEEIREEGGSSALGAIETHISHNISFVFNRPLSAEERTKLSSRITINPVLRGGLPHLIGSLGYWYSSVTLHPEKEPERISVKVEFSMNTRPRGAE